MHIFFLDLFTDIDAISPIIFKLKKKQKKVAICSTNFIQDVGNNINIKYLISKGVKFYCFPKKNLKYLFFKIIIKFLNIFPKNILKRMRSVFKFCYKNFSLFDVEEIKYFLNLSKATSVTIDTSNPMVKIKKIYLACKEFNIKMIFFPSGAEILDYKFYNKDNDLKYCDFYLSQNKLEKFKIKNKKNKDKIKFLGSPRFSDEWLKTIDHSFKSNLNKKKTKKIKIGIFVTPKTENFSIHNKVIEKLKSNKNLIIKFRNKPRDYMPEKTCDYFHDEFSTSELIKWSDYIISAQSSVIIECIKRNKVVFFLNYLVPKNYGSWIKRYNCVDLIKNEHDLINKINKIVNKKYKFMFKNKKEYIRKVVGIEKKNDNVLNRYLNFYNNIV